MSPDKQGNLKTSDGQGSYKSITERSKEIYKTMQFSDCAFRVGPSTTTQKIFKAHKLILSMASVVFEAMFYGKLAEKNFPIDVLDIEPDSFALLLQYLYTDRVELDKCDEAIGLCYAAQKYMISSLVDRCIEMLKSILCCSNVLEVYQFAKLMERNDLKEECTVIIKIKTPTILSEPSFIDAYISTLLDIFQMDRLRINSDIELFNGLKRYIDENNKEPTKKIDKKQYRELIQHIRFLSMTPKEFAEGPARSELLELDEKLAIFMHLNSDTMANYPMPTSISKNRNKRYSSKIKQNNGATQENLQKPEKSEKTEIPIKF